MLMTRAASLALVLIVLASCAHPNRVSRRTVNQLTKKHEPFVLIFGSVLPGTEASRRPTIRFIHQANRAAPQYVLHEIGIASGDRFYSVLKAPPELKRLDHFEAELRWGDKPYDKVTYVRLSERTGALAMYLGEIQMKPAEQRTAPGQTNTVSIRDDFQNASQELHRLYPKFDGEVIKSPLLRAPAPQATPPPRQAE